MTQEEKTKFKDLLVAEKKTIEAELAEAGIPLDKAKDEWEAVPEAPDSAVTDPNELADREEDFSQRQSLLSTLGKRHADIVAALLKIESGVYGVCEICGKPIGEDRLMANPAARTCEEHL